MQKQTNINFIKIDKGQTNELTTLVSETLAVNYTSFKTLTTADLWNIQSRRKVIKNRRHLV